MCDTLFGKKELNYNQKLPMYYNSNSELSSIALCHGCSYTGHMSTTFTSSQGLLLMIPSIIKMKGERRPVVVNVATRALATHSLSIDNDNSDLQQLINSGAVVFFASNQQECQFNTILSFLVAKTLKTPVLNCYDGGIISDETQIVEELTKKQIQEIDKLYKEINMNIKETGQIGLITTQNSNMQITAAQKLQNQDDFQKIEKIRQKLNQILKTNFNSNQIYYNQNKFFKKSVKTLYISNGSLSDFIKQNLNENEAVLNINQFTPNQIKIQNFQNVVIVEKNINPYTKSLIQQTIQNQLPNNCNVIYAGIGGNKVNMEDIRNKVQFVGIKTHKNQNKQNIKFIGNTVGISNKQKNQNFFKKHDLTLQIYSTGAQGWSSASDAIIKEFSQQYENVSKIQWHDAKKSGGLVINQIRGSKNKLLEHQLGYADIIFVTDQNTLNQVENQVFSSIKKNGTIIFNNELSLSPKALQIIKQKKINIYIYNQVEIQQKIQQNRTNFFMADKLIKFLQNEEKNLIKPCNQLVKVNYKINDDDQLTIEDVYQFALDPQQENGTADKNCTITEEKQIEIGYNCINCGKCSIHCPHGVLQNVILSQDEAKKLNIKQTKKNQIQINGKTYIRQIFVDKKHCTNCGICVNVCPTKNIKFIENDDKDTWKQVQQIINQPNYYDRVNGIKTNVQQYQPAPLKGHSACAGCGQVEYYNILQRINPNVDIVQSTGCPLVYLGQYNCSPLNKNTFWMNSLFEDGNEVGLGVQLSKMQQNKIDRPTLIIQGDGGAYDIDYNGLDQNLRSNVNLTMIVLNNQCYANTGGQKSGATPKGINSKLGCLSDNKWEQNSKELPLLALTYKHVYIATVTSNDVKRTERIFKRAMEFNGPSLVICYSPCVNHKQKSGFNYLNAQKQAVDSGAFILMEYDPDKQGQERFKIDSKIKIKATDINEERVQKPEQLQQYIDEKWKIYKGVQQMVNNL